MYEINVRTKFSCIRLKDIFYAENLQTEHSGYDAVYYFYCREKRNSCKVFYTLHIDLTQDEEGLLKSFNYQTRKSIRKMFVKRDLEVRIIDQPTTFDLDNFAAYFNKFADMKKISSCPHKTLAELMARGEIVIIMSVISQEILSSYVFIKDEKRVIVCCGCTARLFEPLDKKKLQLICDSHRMADYQAMLYFKKQGFEIFDFCGLVMDNSEKSSASVNQYKLGFGGNKVVEYHFMHPITLKGKIFCWFKQLISGI
jgi:hypothetical protein